MLLLTLRETYALNRLPSFKNLRRKGGKFDHRPGRPKVLLRHWARCHLCQPVNSLKAPKFLRLVIAVRIFCVLTIASAVGQSAAELEPLPQGYDLLHIDFRLAVNLCAIGFLQ